MSLNLFNIVFIVIGTILLFLLPRNWAFLPLLMGVCWIPIKQGMVLGAFHFSTVRMMIAIGLTRVVLRNERLAGGINSMDWLMVIWAALAIASGFFHKDISSALIFRLGFVYSALGVYFLIRIFCHSIEDIKIMFIATAILLIPVAFAMLYESVYLFNVFSLIGGPNAIPVIRGDRVRAVGPFAHPILAGTIGAVCIPLIISVWKEKKKFALFGLISCLIMIFTSASSGPIMSAMVAILALFMWRIKEYTRLVQILAVISIIALNVIMNAPFYYLISRINIIGGSTGWHRAELINSAINHINEWWLWGTDYTRHWMPTGVGWSLEHTDITNYSLHIGIIGGLPLMLCFIVLH